MSHFLELQVVAASLKSMLGLEEVKAWSCCFLFLNSEFEELMRDPMDILWIRFFCRQVSTYPYWVRSCGMPLIKVATGESASWKWDIFPSVLLMHLMNSCDLVFSLVYLWQYTVFLLITADVQQINNCHVTYAQGTAVFNASQRSWWVACHRATSWRSINCGKGGGCGKLQM